MLMVLLGWLLTGQAFHGQGWAGLAHDNTDPGYLARIPTQPDNDSIPTSRRKGHGEETEEGKAEDHRQVQDRGSGSGEAGYPGYRLPRHAPGRLAGTVTEVQGTDTFTIRWSQETLNAIHPVFKNRCEIDGLDPEEYVLTGDDLEPDTGGPLDIEQPTQIKTRPLSPEDQDDRVRMVFGLTSNDPLPDVDDETLERYHEYLSENLSFPFEAEHTSETGPFSSRTIQVKVIGLGDPDEEPMIDDTYGIL
jgi:hypothetical protein